jgi:hypothetical protein
MLAEFKYLNVTNMTGAGNRVETRMYKPNFLYLIVHLDYVIT